MMKNASQNAPPVFQSVGNNMGANKKNMSHQIRLFATFCAAQGWRVLYFNPATP
jgi:hypothetical protein